MKRKVVCILVLFSMAVAVSSLTAYAQQQAVNDPSISMDLTWKIRSWVPIWRIERFHSQTLDQPVGYYLYLPPDYEKNSSRRYPVIYWLHGALGSPANATPVVRRLDAGIRAKRAPAMIVVSCLDPTGLTMWTDSKDGRVPLETVIMEELIPHIDTTYRTVASREGRGIEGFSMGGYGAAYLGFKYPERFSAVSMLAAALHTPTTFKERRRAIFDHVFGGDAGYAQARSPWKLLKQNSDQIRDHTAVRIYVGEKDGLREWNARYHHLLESLKISHRWGIVPASPHDLGVVMRNWQGDFFAFYREAFSKLTSRYN